VHLTTVCNFRKLELLGLKQIRKRDVDAILDNCPNLRSFCFGKSPLWGVRYWRIGKCCPLLQELAIVQDEGFVRHPEEMLTKGCGNLRKLIITGCHGSGCYEEELCAMLSECPLLEWVDLSYSGANDEVMHRLAEHCPRLQVAILAHCEGVTDAGLLALARGFARLASLRVSGCGRGVTDEGLEAVKALCPKLRARQVHDRWLGEEVHVY
jgi:hypothetical protein